MKFRQSFFLILLTCCLSETVFPQDRVRLDSLEILLRIAQEQIDPDSMLRYSSLIIENSEDLSEKSFLQEAYQIRGTGWRLKGDFDSALNSYLKSLKIAEDLDDDLQVGKVNIEIGNVYSENDNPALAKTYYSRGLSNLRRAGNENSLGRGFVQRGR